MLRNLNMKSLMILFIFLLSLPAFASKMGLGISLGNPTGLNGKYWLTEKTAVDAGLAMSFGKHANFSLHSDYLFHKEGEFYFNDDHPLDLYYGIGARMEFADDIEIGVRLPVGLAHRVENNKADMFAEVAPILDFISRKGLELHILFGARYYFN
jgi:hypothetical protein